MFNNIPSASNLWYDSQQGKGIKQLSNIALIIRLGRLYHTVTMNYRNACYGNLNTGEHQLTTLTNCSRIKHLALSQLAFRLELITMIIRTIINYLTIWMICLVALGKTWVHWALGFIMTPNSAAI